MAHARTSQFGLMGLLSADRIVAENGAAREIETADENVLGLIQRARRRHAEATRDDPVETRFARRVGQPLLSECIDGAVPLAAGGIEAFRAFDDHGEVGGKLASAAPLERRPHPKHHAQPLAVRALRARETYADTAAIRTRSAVALDLGVAPVDVEIQGAANPRPQIAIAAGQATRRRGARS